MKRDLNMHLRWLTALAVLPACGDDGATASATDTDTDADTDDSSSSDEATITLTTADTSAGPTTADTTSTDADTTSSSTGPVAECGNDVIEDGEVCDGADLGDATCESEGFGAGMLLCAPDCSFDTSECPAATECGNGIIEDGEDCDGADLGDETCLSQDFDNGDLACAGDCTLDITACVNLSCGDGEINGKEECDGDALPNGAECGDFGTGTVGCTDNCVLEYSNCCGDGNIGSEEVCDGDDLGGANCGIVGEFDAGTLSCAAACTEFDTSACTLCGDGVAQGAEVCDGDDLLEADCTSVPGGFFGGTLTCDGACGTDTSGCNFCGNGDIDDGEMCDVDDLGGATCLSLGFTGGTLGCDGVCGYDEGGCTNLPLPGATELVITEIMQNPSELPDEAGEYFELHNPSLVESFQLQGCVVEGGGFGESFVIATDLVIDAGDYLSFAATADPGFTPDYVWSGFVLNNGTDTARLVCDGVTVDSVTYDNGATFPDPTGVSMQLEPTSTDTVSNDTGSNWCESGVPFGPGDFGTPGTANTSCLPPVFTVDFCRLQSPTAVSELGGTEVDVFGRVFVGGLTDLSGANDPDPNVLMQVGHGPDGSDPAVSLDWVWQTGAPQGDYGPLSPGYEANNDEYVATLTVPDPGESDFAVRFTGDGGLSYTYCDGGAAGSSDGYAPADAGQMTSLPLGDAAALYFSEYYEGTGVNKVVEIHNPGVDAVNLAGCAVVTFFNGNPVAAPAGGIALTGIVDAGGVHVLCSASFGGFPFCDQLSGGLSFGGDDAVELRCDGVTNDVIGQIGVDPGVAWTGGDPLLSTGNSVLRRNCDVIQGDPDGSNAFDPSIQWTGLPINSSNQQPENTGDLGIYVCID